MSLMQLFITVIILLLSIIFILITIIIKLNGNKNYTYWSRKNVSVGQMPSTFAIIIKKLQSHVIDQQLVNKYGKIFGTHRMGKPTLFCADPDIISCVLIKDFTTFPNRISVSSINEITEHFLTVIKDDKWKRIRSIVTPTFSSGKLRKIKPIVDECVQTLINDFNRLIKEDNVLDVKRVFGAFTTNSIISFAFGVKLDALTDQNHPLIANLHSFLNFNLIDTVKYIIHKRFFRLGKFFNLNNVKLKETKFLSEFALKIIDERKSNKTQNRRNDFLDLLLEALENNENVSEKNLENNFPSTNKTITPIEIASQCVLFFVAGSETTNSTLSYCAYNLACNTESQQTLYEEAKNFFENNDEVDYDLINNLKYTDAVISETLRLYPPASSIGREVSVDYILPNGIKVSKGEVIHIPIYVMHKNPEYFPDPNAFKPERFFPENRSHHPYAYLPFGAGPRNCVAKRFALIELKLAILYSVYNFRFSVCDKTERPPKLCGIGASINTKKIFLKVEKR